MELEKFILNMVVKPQKFEHGLCSQVDDSCKIKSSDATVHGHREGK